MTDIVEQIEAWRFNVELECSGASRCAIDKIAIGGAVLTLDSLLPVLEFASEAADAIERLQAELAEAREDLLWNAYHTGCVKNGRWSHMCMSDGEWLVRECGLDPKVVDYDDAEIRAAIPAAAIRERTDGR